jgi:four helix bundle protein
MRDYRKIRTWRLADDLVVEIYRQSGSFPVHEMYGLISQWRRAGYSVPSNIAEGAARESDREYLHFLYIARASLAEVRYFCHLSKRLGYLDETSWEKLDKQIANVAVRLHRLIESMQNKVGIVKKVAACITSGLVIWLAKATCGLSTPGLG